MSVALAHLVVADIGASRAAGRHEDVGRALKGQQSLPDKMDAQPRAIKRISHQLLRVAAANALQAVTSGNAVALPARRVHAARSRDVDAARRRAAAEDDLAIEAAKEVGVLSREQHRVVIDLRWLQRRHACVAREREAVRVRTRPEQSVKVHRREPVRVVAHDKRVGVPPARLLLGRLHRVPQMLERLVDACGDPHTVRGKARKRLVRGTHSRASPGPSCCPAPTARRGPVRVACA